MTPNPQDSAVALEVERAAFEAAYVQYAQALGAGFESIADLRMGEEYQSHYITGMWEGWKMRASLSTSKQAGAEPVAWEYRKRIPNNPAWSEWTTCLERDHIAIQKNALHWGMVYQSRALCLVAPHAPNQSQGENHVG